MDYNDDDGRGRFSAPSDSARWQAKPRAGAEEAIHSAPHPLRETLDTLFDGSGADTAKPYCGVALLDARGDRLIGRQTCCSRTGEALRRLAQDGWTLDGLFGCRSERRSSPSRSARGVVREDAITFQARATENIAVRAFADGAAHVTRDLYDLVRPSTQPEVAAAVQRALRLRSITVLPLLVQSDCLGLLAVAYGEDNSPPLRLPLLARLAAQMALSVENARLNHELRQLEHQVSVLLKATIDAQEEERERICLEIHDGVAQTLAPAFHYLQTLDRAAELPEHLRAKARKAETLVREAIREAREVIGTLRPAALDTLGLAATLQFEVDELASQRGWQVDFDSDQVRFPKAVETALYRIIHEAITNVSKHASARRVVVRVKHKDGRVLASVQDDGVGFDPSVLERSPHRKAVGLLSMRKRTELLDGDFTVRSDPGRGTFVCVEVPISRITEIVQEG